MERKFNPGDMVIRRRTLEENITSQDPKRMFPVLKIQSVTESSDGSFTCLPEGWSPGTQIREGEFISVPDALEYALDHVAWITKNIINHHKEISK